MATVDELLRKIYTFEHTGKLSADQRDTIGAALDEVQRILPRGEFGPWIAQNLWFSYGMASYYMKCYRDNSIARKYKETSQAAHNADFFKKYDEATANTMQQQATGSKEMTSDDYKKLVVYMRDNMDLTARLKAMEARVTGLQKDIANVRQQSATKDLQIQNLRRELEMERNGSDPFASLFGRASSGLSKAEYRSVMSAVHPDKAATPEQREAFTRVSQIINAKMKTH